MGVGNNSVLDIDPWEICRMIVIHRQAWDKIENLSKLLILQIFLENIRFWWFTIPVLMISSPAISGIWYIDTHHKGKSKLSDYDTACIIFYFHKCLQSSNPPGKTFFNINHKIFPIHQQNTYFAKIAKFSRYGFSL